MPTARTAALPRFEREVEVLATLTKTRAGGIGYCVRSTTGHCSLPCASVEYLAHVNNPEEQSVYDAFWWCSAMARMDTRDTRRDVRERYPSGGGTSIRSILPPEETTTFSFVRRLAYQHRKRGGKGVVAFHSKALEGGFAGKRPPSGADIELAVEVTSGNWIDLLLQAKRIYEPRAGQDGVYEGWKKTQVRALRRWAARNGDRTPAMLLYNAQVSPFVAPGNDVTLDGCCMSPIECDHYRWPMQDPPNRRSPIGITLIVLPALPSRLPHALSVDSLPANIANRYASPLECIFCPSRLTGGIEASGGRMRGPISVIRPKRQIPQWAAILLEAAGERADVDERYSISEIRQPMDKHRWDACCSIVLPHIPTIEQDAPREN